MSAPLLRPWSPTESAERAAVEPGAPKSQLPPQPDPFEGLRLSAGPLPSAERSPVASPLAEAVVDYVVAGRDGGRMESAGLPPLPLPTGLLPADWALDVAFHICYDYQAVSVWREYARRTLAGALLLALEAAAEDGPDVEWSAVRDALLGDLAGLLDRGAPQSAPTQTSGEEDFVVTARRRMTRRDRDTFIAAVRADFREMPPRMRASVVAQAQAAVRAAVTLGDLLVAGDRPGVGRRQ